MDGQITPLARKIHGLRQAYVDRRQQYLTEIVDKEMRHRTLDKQSPLYWWQSAGQGRECSDVRRMFSKLLALPSEEEIHLAFGELLDRVAEKISWLQFVYLPQQLRSGEGTDEQIRIYVEARIQVLNACIRDIEYLALGQLDHESQITLIPSPRTLREHGQKKGETR